MPIRPLAFLAAASLLAACQPPPATSVQVGSDAIVTSDTPAAVTVIPDATGSGTTVGVTPTSTATAGSM